MVETTQIMHASPRRRTMHDYVRIFLKRKWLIMLVFFCILAYTALTTFTETPIYQATVQILIERQTPNYLNQPGGSAQYGYFGEEFYQTQYKLLQSQALAKKVVEKLNLRDNPRYAPLFRNLPPNADEAIKKRAEESLISAVASGVQVNPVRQSSLVNVSFSDPDPKFAATLVNTLAQSYIEQSLDLRFAASREAAVWLRKKLIEGRKNLEESEAKLNQYKRDHNIVAPDDKESITAQKLEQLNKDLIAAQTRRMEAETRFNEVNQGKPISQVLDNPLIQTLKGQEAKLIAEQSELSHKFGPEHPRMIQLAKELAATGGKIAAEKSQVVQAIKNEYYMAKEQEENLRKALDAQKAATQDLSDRNIKYRVLLRDVETNRALYQNMLQSLKTTVITESTPATNIRIVYPATVPSSPISPRKTRNLMTGALLGLFFGFGLALGVESFDTTLKTPEEMEEWLEIPNVALIPHMEFASGNPVKEEFPELIMHHGQQPLASESYLGLRTSILFSSPGQAPRTLLVTSSLPLEGKSLTSSNLATAMAKAEPEVLLVDADLRRPALHKVFHLPAEPGLTNFLVGELDDIPVLETVVPNLFLVPAGKIPPHPSELLGSDRMRKFFDLAKDRFKRIIMDSPPLMSVTDAAILATLVEGVLLVVKAEAVPRKAAMEARDQLLEVNAPLLGTIFNNFQVQKAGYNYNYYYRYHSYYHRDDKNSSARHRTPSPPGALGWMKNRLTRLKQTSKRT
jgi:succinoglycan biosynthesis transport protein ExoP